MLQFFQRLDDVCERRALQGRELLDASSTTLQQLTHAGLDVLRANACKRWQGLLAQKRVFHAVLASGIPPILSSWKRLGALWLNWRDFAPFERGMERALGSPHVRMSGAGLRRNKPYGR